MPSATWVGQRDGWRPKAESYSLSNRLLKTPTYGLSSAIGGRVRPSRVVVNDALRQHEMPVQVSVMDYADIRAREPACIFTKELPREAALAHAAA